MRGSLRISRGSRGGQADQQDKQHQGDRFAPVASFRRLQARRGDGEKGPIAPATRAVMQPAYMVQDNGGKVYGAFRA